MATDPHLPLVRAETLVNDDEAPTQPIRQPSFSTAGETPGTVGLSAVEETDIGSGYLTPMEHTTSSYFAANAAAANPSTSGVALDKFASCPATSGIDHATGRSNEHAVGGSTPAPPQAFRRARTTISGSGQVSNEGINSRPGMFQRRSSRMEAVYPPGGKQTRTRTGETSVAQTLGEALSKQETAASDKVSIKDRIACYRWTFFTMTMATGGIANVLHALQYTPNWITGIGVFFCLLNICIFLTNCTLLSARFYLRPGSFTASFHDQVESLFIPAFVVSIGIILLNICEYGIHRTGPWLLHTMEILFWVYAALSIVSSAGLYLILWSSLVFPVHMMTPTWVFPAYPLLLTAPLAANLIASAAKSGYELKMNTVALAFGAATIQGTGCLIAFMISAAFIYRLMTQKLPRDMQRPGVFISIGPFGFTAAGIAQLGSQADLILPSDFLDVPNAASIIKVMSLLVSLWLWGLSMWFFLVSVGSLWKYVRGGHSMPFQMTWWSFVFPNTALVTATEVMGRIFNSKGVQMFGSVMTACLIVVWIIVFLTMMHCLRTRKLLWPKSEV